MEEAEKQVAVRMGLSRRLTRPRRSMSEMAMLRQLTMRNYLPSPSPFLRSTGGPQQREFYCSLCKIKFETEIPSPPKAALVRTREGALPELSKEWQSAIKNAKAELQKEWDEHLCNVHPRQWERE
jgi:hypothetical protein